MSLIGKVFDERYEVVENVGKGGMALVFRAIDRRTRHSVALKVLRPEFSNDAEFLARFEREALAASKMSHHNIVNLLDVGIEGDLHYLVMEYVQGRTLKEIIQEKGALSTQTSVQIAVRILSALQHAHKNGIIHRDIKPQNILVHSEGLIKVADFGIARMAGTGTITDTDTVMGSVHYFSPEQAKGESVTFASDLYSVGVVMYEMLTGYVPFDGETPYQVAMQHISAQPRPMAELKEGIPSAIEQVVMTALQKNPLDRYQSAYEMAQALNEALELLEKGEEHAGTSSSDNTQIIKKQKQGRVSAWLKKHSRGRRRTIKRVLWTGISLIMLAVICFFGIKHMNRYVFNAASAPYVLDETEDSAVRLIEKAGLVAKVSRASDNIKPAGTVILQTPEYDTDMLKGDTVYITVSTGPSEQPMPDFTSYTSENAAKEAEKYGMTLIVVGREMSDKPVGTILSQIPEAGTIMQGGGVVSVTVSGGRVEVPNLVGMDRDEALYLAQTCSLQITGIREIATSDPNAIGKVAAQLFTNHDVSYKPGDYCMEGTSGELAVYVQMPEATEEIVKE